ncbi:Gfo/Idh/MocA family protein [Microvirga terrestris]|uniref:Gfo/Idh/MocA family oxidoreductase n=1 Tax=Microvirga terrestris TaxID=2791024 RepID=A0ABS0HXI3_9HYPH|nr:Gfo/Idh/MocA family oxidoreductase [Microvirga terrestris]MBF9198223.1 Gfo/Idh/MocA family oxidoreductase [Microvirga terrestris]
MYGIGIVGLGTMGRRLAESIRANHAFDIVAAYDPAVAETTIPLARSVADLVGNPSVRCVYVATPPLTHEEIVRTVADAGKALLCEKPLAASPNAAWACVDAVTRAGIPAAVNFPFATAPAAVRLKELVGTGALGENLSAHLTLRFRQWPREWQQGAASWLAGPEQGGFTREVVSHFAFLALRLFGPGHLAECRVERGPLGTETRVHAVLRFASVTMTIDAAVDGNQEEFNRFEVKGSRSSAVMSEWYRLTHESGDIAPVRADAGQIAELALLLDGRPHRLATFEEAAQVVSLIEEILGSHRKE